MGKFCVLSALAWVSLDLDRVGVKSAPCVFLGMG